MKTELKIFENEAFGKVRVIERNNEPWFVGKDVAEILGYVMFDQQKLLENTLIQRIR